MLVAEGTNGMVDAYHHGDLRRALVEAALAVIDEDGVDALTLRGVARRAGVSHAAPYHHFADLADLRAAVAAECFADLRDRMVRARAAGASPDRQVRELGRSYIDYAVERPNRFRLMWRPELRGPGAPGEVVALAGEESYRPLLAAVAAGQHTRLFRAGEVPDLALFAWATVHGFATLLVDGPLADTAADPARLAAAAENVVELTLTGLLRH